MDSLLKNLEESFQSFETRLNGESKSELHQLRRGALEQLKLKGFPGKKDEEYKFTPLTKVLEQNFEGLEHGINTANQGVEALPFVQANMITIVVVNGEIQELPELPAGVKVSKMAEAYKADEQTILDQLNALQGNDAFANWNTAMMREGLFIEVNRNAQIEQPILIQHSIDAEESQQTHYFRNLVVVNQGASVSINEIILTTGDQKSFSNVVTQVDVKSNAHLEYTKVQNDQPTAYQFNHTAVRQDRDSNFKSNTMTLDGAMIRNNIHIEQNGENCESHMYGLYLLKGKTHVDNHTVVDHTEPNSYSNELYKGVVDEKARAVFNGKIYVRQKAQKTNAFQSNNNILLTDSATVNTKPQLEIWADDVKCSHGCTIGQLDQEAIFYLRARGIDEVEAKAMLLYAFAKDALEHISVDELKAHLDQQIAARLTTHG